MVRWLAEQGKQAEAVPTQFEGEIEEATHEEVSGETESKDDEVEIETAPNEVSEE